MAINEYNNFKDRRSSFVERNKKNVEYKRIDSVGASHKRASGGFEREEHERSIYAVTNKGGNKMEMSHGTDFSEAACDQAEKVYGELIGSIQMFSEKAILGFKEQLKTLPYKQVKIAANCLIEYYNNRLQSEIADAVNEWISSEESFTSSLRSQGEDEEASLDAARKLENHLLELIKSEFKTIPTIDESYAITHNKEIVLMYAERMDSLRKGLDELKEHWMGQYSKLGDQNSLYAMMLPMVAATFTNVESGYESTRKEIEGISQEYEDGRSGSVRTSTDAGNSKKKELKDLSDIFSRRRRR